MPRSESDSDSDSVRTDFTEASIIHSDQEYEADHILAEGQYGEAEDGAITEYLVKWTGYDLDRCTWEPGENCNEGMMSSWLASKQFGTDTLDLAAWNERQQMLSEIRIKRRQKRNRKRIRRGLEPWPTELTGAFYEIREVPDEAPSDPHEEPNELNNSAATTSHADSLAASSKRHHDLYVSSDDDIPLARNKRRKPPTDTPAPTSHKLRPAVLCPTTSQVAQDLASSSAAVTATKAPPHSNTFAALKPAVRREPVPRKPELARRGSHFPGARRALAPNVFTSPPQEASSSSTVGRGGISRRGRPGLHTHLAFRNAANKVKEKAPVHVPRLIELGTGKSIPAPTGASLAARQTSPPNAHLQNFASSPVERTSDDDDDDDDKTDWAGPLTCWFWNFNGPCREGDSCAFEHNRDYPVAGYQNKLLKHQATCVYWATRGKCQYSEFRCAWAHRITGYVVHPDRRPVKMTPEIAEKIHEKLEYSSPASGEIGCWFHHQTPAGCNKSARECSYSHGLVDWVADPGGKGRQARIWVGQISGRRSPPQASRLGKSPSPATRMEADSPSPPPQVIRGPPAAMLLPYTHAPHGLPRTPFSNHSSTFQNTFRDKAPGLSTKMVFQSFDPTVEIAASLDGVERISYSKDIIHACKNMIFTKMLIKPLVGAQLSGSATIGTPNDISSKTVGQLSNIRGKLVEANAAAILGMEACMVLVYPNRQDWRTLVGDSGRGAADLRYKLLQPLRRPSNEPLLPKPSVPVLEEGSFVRNMFAGIDLVQLFALPNGGSMEEYRNIFIVFPNSQKDLLDAFASAIAAKGANVFHSGVSGSWTQFRKLTVTVSKSFVVFHSDIEAYERIPSLYEMLKFSAVDAFCLHPGRTINYPGGGVGTTPAKLTRLFPRGRVVLIMDDCFEEEPEQALEVIDYFAKRSSNAEYGKLIGSPNLLDRLLDPQSGTSSSTRELLIESWQYLNGIRERGLTEHGEVTSDSELLDFFCPVEENLPDYIAKWQSGDAAERADASQILAFWFSHWATSHADQWRRFVLVTTGNHKVRSELQNMYQHLMVVQPDKYLRLEEAIEKNKISQGRVGEPRRPSLRTSGLSGSSHPRTALTNSAGVAPMAVMGTGSGASTPIEARLTPRSTPRSPDIEFHPQGSDIRPVDPRLKMRKENKQRAGGTGTT